MKYIEMKTKILARLRNILLFIKFSFFMDGKIKNDITRNLYKVYAAIIVQNSGICNARCIFCTYRLSTTKKEIMSNSVFEKVKHEFIEMGGGNFGFLCIQGEPTLDPQIIQRIKDIKTIPSTNRISMITNAIILHKLGIENLINSGLDMITISTSIFNKDEYMNVYGSNEYEQMYNNIIELLQKNHNKISITIGIRSSIPTSKIVKSVDFVKISKLTKKISFVRNFASWSGQITKKDLIGSMKLKRNKKYKKVVCHNMLYCANIFENGDVGLCSCRQADELIIGNIMYSPLKDIYFGQKRKTIINNFNKGKLLKICKKCTFYTPAYELIFRKYIELKRLNEKIA